MNIRETRKYFEDRVMPYIWEGTLWLDGGWGPKNPVIGEGPTAQGGGTVISDLALEFAKDKIPFMIKPVSKLGQHLTYGPKGEILSAHEATVGESYYVAFPGVHWEYLLKVIQRIEDATGGAKQEWIFRSYLDHKRPPAHSHIYRLHIISDKKNKERSFRVLEGRWAPVFDKTKAVAGWKQPD